MTLDWQSALEEKEMEERRDAERGKKMEQEEAKKERREAEEQAERVYEAESKYKFSREDEEDQAKREVGPIVARRV